MTINTVFKKLLLSAAISTGLFGCGGGSGGANESNKISSSPTVEASSIPELTGSPSSTATQGDAYVFQPAASDVDGDALTFSVENLPVWARFDNSTGRLSGTPGTRDTGLYNNIRIAVNDGEHTVLLPAFSIRVGVVNAPVPVSVIPEPTSFPISLQGNTPEEVIVSIGVVKPAAAVNATLILKAFDADHAREGELIINGNSPITLFGVSGLSGNNQKRSDVAINTPALGKR